MCSGWARISFSTSGIFRVAHVSSNPLMTPFQSIPFMVKHGKMFVTTIKGYSSSSV